MSTQPRQVEIAPFGTPQQATVVGTAPRHDSPFSWARVRIEGREGVWRVPEESLAGGDENPNDEKGD